MWVVDVIFRLFLETERNNRVLPVFRTRYLPGTFRFYILMVVC